ncbi:ubiquitin-like protein Pup [Serinicoccus marinus]|uniref:ubiquitin-like protein Pup n=1 Tax=Serinicoccus marinus TaxID=247333 RepID=UPI0003B61857|nr:ubiquitin-like protein Pup [Serinicoccus marinus]
MSQQHFQRRGRESGGDGEPGPDADGATPPSAPAAQSAERDAALDSLLDEIDGVLESNATEFVHGFVQKGGE